VTVPISCGDASSLERLGVAAAAGRGHTVNDPLSDRAALLAAGRSAVIELWHGLMLVHAEDLARHLTASGNLRASQTYRREVISRVVVALARARRRLYYDRP
jgi:hypothetical protein